MKAEIGGNCNDNGTDRAELREDFFHEEVAS